MPVRNPKPAVTMIIKVPLTKGKWALVDEADYYKIMFLSFQAQKGHNTWYASDRNGKMLHRLILGLSDNDPREVDHIDGDGLNNVRSNLRICSQSRNRQNAKARGDYKGVTYNKREKKYKARIQCGLIRLTVGTFDTAEEAARTYDKRARQLHGAFARLNFPEDNGG